MALVLSLAIPLRALLHEVAVLLHELRENAEADIPLLLRRGAIGSNTSFSWAIGTLVSGNVITEGL